MRRARWVGFVAILVLGLALATLRAAGPDDDWGLDIDRTMDAIGVWPGMIVGEAGAGGGYFTLPMARRLGRAGAVYANDIDKTALRSLFERAELEGLTNVHVVEGAVDDPLFPRRDLQRIVIVHAFHDFAHPVRWLVNAKKYLRPGGVVAIVDRDPTQGAPTHFWPASRIQGYADMASYDTVKTLDSVSKHLIIVVRPRPAS